MFLEIDSLPAAKELAQQALADLGALQDHASKALYTTWPELFLHGGGWTTYPLKWQGRMINDVWPWLRDSRVLNAGYSRLAPGTVIRPHCGYTSAVLRLHVGLSCPGGDCALQVGGETRGWADGEVLLFDDTVRHSAWNRTDRDRVVLLVDLIK